MVKISKKHIGLGSEHPLCDRIQPIMIILFFIVLAIDSFSFYVFGYSTALIGLFSFPILLLPAILSLVFGLYFIAKSHKAVLVKKTDKPRFIDSGVYSWVRHPMYLGILLFCLSFFFISPSLLSLVIWIAFFIIYDRMTIFEEKDLVRILGKKYIDYQKRVPKWLPKISMHKNKNLSDIRIVSFFSL